SASALGGKNQFLKQNPLFALLSPFVGQSGPYPGPVVGQALKKDTARVNAILRMPEVKALMPQNMRLLWGVKPMGSNDEANANKDQRFELYAMKLSGADNTAALSGEVVTDARSDIDQQKGGYEVTM